MPENNDSAELAGRAKKNFQNIKEVLYISILAIGLAAFWKGTIAEARYIPSGSMEPTLNVNDRIIVEKLSYNLLGRKIQRGDVVVFYPPEVETGMADNGLLGRFIPVLPESPPAFIKRVIGLPGDQIEIKRGAGIFVNGQLLEETGYKASTPDYDLLTLGDIKGNSMDGSVVNPFPNSKDPIVVPEKQLFMLGDNRNNSADSHVWGFVDEDRVAGKECAVYWKDEWLKGPRVQH